MPTATLQPTLAGAGLGTIAGTAATPTTTMPLQQQQQQASKPQPLRRAVYVHVSDLLSAYNIDHAKLEEELQRVKGCAGASTTAGGVPTELDTNSNPKKLQPPRGGFNLCVYVRERVCVESKQPKRNWKQRGGVHCFLLCISKNGFGFLPSIPPLVYKVCYACSLSCLF